MSLAIARFAQNPIIYPDMDGRMGSNINGPSLIRAPDWPDWTPSQPVTVLAPEADYEGAHLALEPSERGWAPEPVRQLRGPALYREGDKTNCSTPWLASTGSPAPRSLTGTG